jgi:hypothetical protein
MIRRQSRISGAFRHGNPISRQIGDIPAVFIGLAYSSHITDVVA